MKIYTDAHIKNDLIIINEESELNKKAKDFSMQDMRDVMAAIRRGYEVCFSVVNLFNTVEAFNGSKVEIEVLGEILNRL